MSLITPLKLQFNNLIANQIKNFISFIRRCSLFSLRILFLFLLPICRLNLWNSNGFKFHLNIINRTFSKSAKSVTKKATTTKKTVELMLSCGLFVAYLLRLISFEADLFVVQGKCSAIQSWSWYYHFIKTNVNEMTWALMLLKIQNSFARTRIQLLLFSFECIRLHMDKDLFSLLAL